MAKQAQRSLKELLRGLLNRPTRILFLPAVCLATFSCGGTIPSADRDGETPTSVTSDEKEDESSPASKDLKEKTAAKKGEQSIADKSQTLPGESEPITRSRLLDMAIERGDAMEKLRNQTAKDYPHVPGSSSSLSSLSIEPTASGSTGGNANISKTSLDQLKAELQNRQKQFGDDHPYTIEAAINLSVAMERLHENSEPTARAAARAWLKFVQRLSTYAADPKHSSTGAKDTHTYDLDKLISELGLRRVCKWAHNSGEILAMLLWGHQENDEAIQIAKCIPAIDRIPSYDFLDASVSLHRLLTLARLCASQNEYGEAKKIIAAAKEMAAKQRSAGLMNHHHSMAMCLLEESRLSIAQRDFSAATELARQASAILERAADIEQSQSKALRADVLEQLARSLAAFPTKISEAIENQEKCLRLRQEHFGKDGIYTWSTALELARLLRQKLSASSPGKQISADTPEARRTKDLLQQILAVCKRNQQSDNEVLRADRNATLLMPQTYFEMGLLAATCANFAEARDDLKKANDIDMSFTEPALIPYKVADLDALAAIDLHEAKVAAARAMVLKASGLLNSYVADVLPQLSLAEQIAFTDNIQRHMNSLLAVCRDDGSLAGLYSEMIRWKGFLLEQFRLRSVIIKQRTNPAMNKLLSSHQKLSSRILSNMVQSGSTINGTSNEIQSRKEEIERQINASMRGKEQQSLTLTSKELQSSLGTNEALVDLYEFSSSLWDKQTHYGAVVSTRDRLRWVDLGLTNTINQALNSWRSPSQIHTAVPEIADSKAEKPAAQSSAEEPWTQLHTLLYEPLNKTLPNIVSNLWISDESELARLPWSVLMSSFAGARRYEVCQVDSPRELIALKRRTNSGNGRNSMLIVGGIDYSKHDPPAPLLKHALNEVQEIQKEVEGLHLKCVVQSDFLDTTHPTRKHIMTALSSCQLAHLVTHGFFNNTDSNSSAADAFQMPTRNPLIESGLLISIDPGTEGDKGFLTAEDLLDADLDGCKLITLSACETARGQELNSQGVLGLRSALMGAGARSVLLSLWPVPDRPTSELMKAFYQKLLAGSTPVAALREAQTAVRSHEKWHAPYYWAGWIIVGDGWEKISARN